MPEPSHKETCCQMRRKVVVGILAVVPEETCGISDIDMGPFIRFDIKSPTGSPVIAFLYCPWCGKQRGENTEARITQHVADLEENEDLDDFTTPDFLEEDPE